jgi:hypothetical protein
MKVRKIEERINKTSPLNCLTQQLVFLCPAWCLCDTVTSYIGPAARLAGVTSTFPSYQLFDLGQIT